MSIVRAKHSFDDHFTQIPNAWIRDPRLSLKAKGLLAQLMSHTPGWNVSLKSLARDNGCGIDLIRSAIDELRRNGYLIRSGERERDERGQLLDYVYTTADPGISPTLEKPTLEKPTLEKPTPKKNISKEEHLEEIMLTDGERDSDFDAFWKIYPRKVGKEAARRVFLREYARHRDEMLAGVQRLAADPNLPEQRFIPHAATWLNRGGWDDEPFPERELTPEQKRERDLQAARADRERRVAESAKLRKEMDDAKAKAAPPPKCEHGKTIARCVPCSTKLSATVD